MGALLTRHRFRYLQRAFQQTDFQGKGFLTPEESFELAERFAIQTLRPSDIEDNMDLYGFINFLESHAKQVFVYTDSDEDGLISVSETVSTYAALGILGVDEIKVLMNLRRTQYLYPELINPDDVVATNLPVSFDVWMIGLVEFFFTASVREAVSAASPRKLFEGYGYHDPALRYKTYGVGFRSKIQRFQELTPTLGPGEYDVPTASITIRDPSRPSSSFVTTPRKETKHQVHLGPGEYEPNPFFFTTKKHTLCFQSSAPRIMTNLPGDQEYRTKTEPLIGPGSYESAESRSHLLHKDAACIFPKSQRFVNLFGPPPATGIIGPGEYETAEHKTQPKDGKSKNALGKDTPRGPTNSGPTLPTLNLPNKAAKDNGSKSARDSSRHGRSLSTPRYHTAR